ncbi:hypothetical protein GUJ93_ZPchr0007g5291 [Zizania palustris]|uniref:Late embryogenesis abundant protein LEA-2 subgroup domain-containing protein n=1 Tax=Zizania palustris TaxID=103762 RepID=A0A8J5W5W1_ZIZPA|nr:hypothetical protein GUJ93_ZPchr0007g5291 [Zizania palustris]
MGKQPAASQAGGGEPWSPARGEPGTTPSTTQPPVRHLNESVHGVRHAVAGAPPDQRVRFMTREKEVRFGGEHGPEQSPVHGDAGAEAPARTPRRMPSYVPVWLRRAGQVEQPPHAAPPRPAADHRPPVPAPFAPVPQEWPPHDPRYAPQVQHPHPSLPHDLRYAQPALHPHTSPPRKSPLVLHTKQKKRKPLEFCFTGCCILFWLMVIAVGVAVLVVFLLYHPQSPRLGVTSATLNAGYIDELGVSGGARALNADLTVLAAIYNPNTKIHIVLHYMQLDLYFEGSMIATQDVLPAPLHEGPGGNVLRSVHLLVSEVTVTQEDMFVWQNATTKGGLVVLHLAGRFRTQLNFGRWFAYKYWVTPRCTLWLDPPPSGALRRAQC